MLREVQRCSAPKMAFHLAQIEPGDRIGAIDEDLVSIIEVVGRKTSVGDFDLHGLETPIPFEEPFSVRTDLFAKNGELPAPTARAPMADDVPYIDTRSGRLADARRNSAVQRRTSLPMKSRLELPCPQIEIVPATLARPYS